MKLYGAINLHSNNNVTVLIDEQDQEEFAWERIRQNLQEQQVTRWLRSEKGKRNANPLEEPRHRNEYSRARRFMLSVGTAAVRLGRVEKSR